MSVILYTNRESGHSSSCGYLFWTDQADVDLGAWPAIGTWLKRIRSLPRWQAPYHPLLASSPIVSGTRT